MADLVLCSKWSFKDNRSGSKESFARPAEFMADLVLCSKWSFKDNRSGSKESFARPAEFMADPIMGSMFHRQFECQTLGLKIVLDLPKFYLVQSVGSQWNR